MFRPEFSRNELLIIVKHSAYSLITLALAFVAAVLFHLKISFFFVESSIVGIYIASICFCRKELLDLQTTSKKK